jgi:hypothetical protein
VDWIQRFTDTDRWWALVNTIMNRRVHKWTRNLVWFQVQATNTKITSWYVSPCSLAEVDRRLIRTSPLWYKQYPPLKRRSTSTNYVAPHSRRLWSSDWELVEWVIEDWAPWRARAGTEADRGEPRGGKIALLYTGVGEVAAPCRRCKICASSSWMNM